MELKPVKETTEDFEKMEVEILKVLREEIYLPLISDLGSKVIKNSRDDLLKAMQSGKVSFENGKFTGRFSSTISKELKKLGARWNGESWTIPAGKLPVEVKNAISISYTRFRSAFEKIDEKLSKLIPSEIAEKVKLSDMFNSTLWKTEQKLEQSVKGIVVIPKLTESQSAKIADGYTNDLQKYIKDFTEKEIGNLKTKIKERVLSGERYEGIVKEIQKSYQVSRNKAKFLARQETALMMTTFKQTRYLDAGVKEYKWRCVAGTKSHPVRPMHKRLDGKIFNFENPPITDDKGNKNNPGQDYNCRCQAIPIVKFK